jgi:DNA-binding NtrC family response regulator
LTRADFPSELALGKLANTSPEYDAGITLAEGEKILILKTLDKCGGNKTRAAEILNITPRTIRNKLVEYGISGAEEE